MGKIPLLSLGAVVFMGVASGYGQINTTAGAYVPNHGRVNSVNSGERTILWDLDDAAQSGALNPAQVDEFKHRYNQIQAQKTNAMIERHGSLSKSEWKNLKHQEDQLEHEIEASRWKH